MVRRVTTEDFIERAKKVHGNKYDYSSTLYKNNTTKVLIVCTKCSKTFTQKPREHLAGNNGCCFSKIRVRDTKSFVKQARKRHNDKYDYTEVKYEGAFKKVKIWCRTCATYYWQTPSNHLNKGKYGCKNCSIEKQRKKMAFTREEFISKAELKHGTKYSYDKVVYKNNNTHIKIWCKKCQVYFSQLPSKHLAGGNCAECSKEKRIKESRFSTEQFILKSIEKHCWNYGYAKAIYVNMYSKIKILCLDCNNYFYKTARKHLEGSGCKDCNPTVPVAGEDHWNWKGGISSEPYCPIWSDKEYKADIRKRDDNVCQNPYCFKSDKILAIHHMDYDKKNCHPSNLITVCRACNSRANIDRKWHKEWYQIIMNKKYGYRY
jgi:hypothetical protein